MLPSVCSVIDHRRRQNWFRNNTSDALGYHLVCPMFVLPHFDVICDLLLDECSLGSLKKLQVFLFQIAREKSPDYLLIIYTKNTTTTKTFSQGALFFSSFNWLAETDYNVCQMQTFTRPTLSKSFNLELGNMWELIWHLSSVLPLRKENSLHNN